MNFFERLERRFDKFAIHNLMYYIVICQVVGLVLQTVAPNFLYGYLSLDMYYIINHFQIWRLVTFVLVPGGQNIEGINLLFTAITLYFMYYLGRNLEGVWGKARFNLFYLSGILLNIIGALIVYIWAGPFGRYYSFLYGTIGLTYINIMLIMVCSFIFGEMQVLFYFVIPLKMKYLGIFYTATTVFDMFQAFLRGNYVTAVAIFVALLNFAIFFFATRKHKTISYAQRKRKIKYKEQMHSATSGPRHRCAVCGRTELDDETLEFRYCSRCDGNYEYCIEHLFTHEHVKRH